MNLQDLIERIEAADGPSRELDCLIENSTGLAKFERDPRIGYGDADYNRVEPKPFTSSIDAAMTLVPEGFFFQLDTEDCEATVFGPLWADDDGGGGKAKTPALALCAAALRAKMAKNEG